MKRILLTSVLSVSLATGLPTTAQADGKDLAIGAILGVVGSAIVNNEANKNRKAKTQPRASNTQSSLNSTYTRDERVQIQLALQQKGYPVGTIDGILGRNSRAMIGQFQASLGQPQTGELTRQQFAALMGTGFAGAQQTSFDRPLDRNEVFQLQSNLRQLGFYRGAVDGVSGPGTQSAMTSFLASQGRAPGTTTQVETLVLASNALGVPVQLYLQQEAQSQLASTNAFNTTPQNGFNGGQQGSTFQNQQMTGNAFFQQQQGLSGTAQRQTTPFTGQQAAFNNPQSGFAGQTNPLVSQQANPLVGQQQNSFAGQQGNFAGQQQMGNAFAPPQQSGGFGGQQQQNFNMQSAPGSFAGGQQQNAAHGVQQLPNTFNNGQLQTQPGIAQQQANALAPQVGQQSPQSNPVNPLFPQGTNGQVEQQQLGGPSPVVPQPQGQSGLDVYTGPSGGQQPAQPQGQMVLQQPNQQGLPGAPANPQLTFTATGN